MDLREELERSLWVVDNQIAAIKAEARNEGVAEPDIYWRKYASGEFVLAPLLVAKAQLLHSLVLLKEG